MVWLFGGVCVRRCVCVRRHLLARQLPNLVEHVDGGREAAMHAEDLARERARERDVSGERRRGGGEVEKSAAGGEGTA